MNLKKYEKREKSVPARDLFLNIEDISAVYTNFYGVTTIVLQCGLEFEVNDTLQKVLQDLSERIQNVTQKEECCGSNRGGGRPQKRNKRAKVNK